MNNYLTLLLEQATNKSLPSDLIQYLVRRLYPSMYSGTHQVKDVMKTNKDLLIWLKHDRRAMPFQKSKDLFGIFSYGNGDSAWYSFRDKKVYDFNHELGIFNPQATPIQRKELWMAQPYKQWIRDTFPKGSKNSLHMDAWKNTYNELNETLKEGDNKCRNW